MQHGSYGDNPVPSNDVALLHLNRAANPPIQPLRLVDSSETALWAQNTVARIIGWGTTCSSGCSTSTQLRETDVAILSDSTCSGDYGSPFSAMTTVCAAAAGKDTCQGDSGGPLMVQRQGEFMIAGITSWGTAARMPGIPASTPASEPRR